MITKVEEKDGSVIVHFHTSNEGKVSFYAVGNRVQADFVHRPGGRIDTTVIGNDAYRLLDVLRGLAK